MADLKYIRASKDKSEHVCESYWCTGWEAAHPGGLECNSTLGGFMSASESHNKDGVT